MDKVPRLQDGQNQTVTQTIPATYNGIIYVLGDTSYIRDPNSETEAKTHHGPLHFSKDRTSTVRIQTKDEVAHLVMIAGGVVEGVSGSDWPVCGEYKRGGL